MNAMELTPEEIDGYAKLLDVLASADSTFAKDLLAFDNTMRKFGAAKPEIGTTEWYVMVAEVQLWTSWLSNAEAEARDRLGMHPGSA